MSFPVIAILASLGIIGAVILLLWYIIARHKREIMHSRACRHEAERRREWRRGRL